MGEEVAGCELPVKEKTMPGNVEHSRVYFQVGTWFLEITDRFKKTRTVAMNARTQAEAIKEREAFLGKEAR